MAFLVLGLVLLALKVAAFGPVAEWSWLAVLAPFGLAAVWWVFADASGLTRRRAMDKMDQRKAERRKRDIEALGLGVRTARPAARAAAPAAKPVKRSVLPQEDSRHDIRAADDESRSRL